MSEKKEFNFTGLIISTLFIIIISFVGGAILSYFMSPDTFELFSDTTLGLIFIIFCAIFLMYILSVTGKDKDSKLKGKKDMENQHFASINELNKNFTHCWYSDLKNMSITGVPFRFEYKRKNLHIHFTPACHVLIVGASGTGKTACWVEPTMQILSELKNRPSLFITDPKGEIFAHHSLKLKNQG